MRLVTRLIVVALVSTPLAALAAGGHDMVGCAGCHGLRRGASSPGQTLLPGNTKYLNPKTNQPYAGTTAFCLACHAEEKNGGKGFAPVSQHTSHPFGLATVNPKVARVPAQVLKDGRFECMSCHDPHPSNPNYKYLRADVGAKGEKIDQFCGVCHGSKADPSAQNASLFTSADESGPRTMGAAAAPAAAPAKKK